jgi:hypothetical protein
MAKPEPGAWMSILYRAEAEFADSDEVRPHPPFHLLEGFYTPLDSSHLSLAQLRANRDKCLAERNETARRLKDFMRTDGRKAVPLGNMSLRAFLAACAEADARTAISARVGLGHQEYCTCSPTQPSDFVEKSLKELLAPCKSGGGPCH